MIVLKSFFFNGVLWMNPAIHEDGRQNNGLLEIVTIDLGHGHKYKNNYMHILHTNYQKQEILPLHDTT